jgi:hypothetical protein
MNGLPHWVLNHNVGNNEKLNYVKEECRGNSSIQVGVLGGLLGEGAAEGEDGLPDPLDDVGGVHVEVGLVGRDREHAEPPALPGVVCPRAAVSSSSDLGREGDCARKQKANTTRSASQI